MRLKLRFARQRPVAAKAGSAGRGARIRWERMACGLLLASLAALMTVACGGSSSGNLSQTGHGNGALFTFISDTPSCDLLSMGIFVTEMDLHRVGNPSTTLLTVWPTNNSPVSPVVQVNSLRDAMTVLNFTTIPPGDYDQIVLRVIVNSSSTYDPTQSPPVKSFNPIVQNSKVVINLKPDLIITSGRLSAVKLDLNLPQSLNVDSQGQLTGTINWVFSAYPMVASPTNGFGEMDALHGFVRTVTNSSPGVGFTGSFLLQTLSATTSGQGPALNVDFTDNTNFCVAGSCNTPVSQINQLPTGSYVEVDGYVNENGNLVATTVQVEDRENLSQNLLAYLGPVLDVTRDPSGNVTQFEMLVSETEPTDPVQIPNSTPVTVYVSSATTFNPLLIDSDLLNLASSGNLSFDASTLAPGQEVVVHGVFSKSTGGPITVAANSVYPRFQAVQGKFLSLSGSPGSDNKTGAFQMAPCSDLVNNSPFMVVTDAQTAFENTSGLSTLSPTSSMLARGLMFLDAKGSTVNGVQIPAGTQVLLAKQVQQF